MALSKNRIKYIRSLELKKNRKADKVFLAEGPKLVGDLLGHFRCRFLIATAEWLSAHKHLSVEDITEVSEQEEIVDEEQAEPEEAMDASVIGRSLCLALDDVQDPGNLGTIIRLADWFGIEHIFCSPNTVDVYNPKTVQATMGGIARVKLHYTSLPELIGSLKDIPVYGTFLDGANMYTQPLSAHGLIVMGNEGNGIGNEVEQLINRKLYIPNYPSERETSESLNVAIATAVVCAEFRRQAALL